MNTCIDSFHREEIMIFSSILSSSSMGMKLADEFSHRQIAIPNQNEVPFRLIFLFVRFARCIFLHLPPTTTRTRDMERLFVIVCMCRYRHSRIYASHHQRHHHQHGWVERFYMLISAKCENHGLRASCACVTAVMMMWWRCSGVLLFSVSGDGNIKSNDNNNIMRNLPTYCIMCISHFSYNSCETL